MEKVKVYGKGQGWTALGIIDAYLKIHPYATLDELNKAFPREKFMSAKNVSTLLMKMSDSEDVEQTKKIHWYLTLEDGTDIVFNKVCWGKGNFPPLCEFAKQYGIEIAEFSKTKGGTERGNYELEYLADFDTVTVTGNKIVETLMKEFNAAFPYLQLCIFPLSMKDESTKTPVDRKITIAQARAQAPSSKQNFSLDGNCLVEKVEKEFIEKHGLYVQICYYNKEGKGYYTTGNYDKMSLAELNKEIEKIGGPKDKWY